MNCFITELREDAQGQLKSFFGLADPNYKPVEEFFILLTILDGDRWSKVRNRPNLTHQSSNNCFQFLKILPLLLVIPQC